MVLPLYIKDDNFREPPDPMYYLLARNGLYLVRRSELFTTELRVEGLPWLEPHAERAQLHPPSRIPVQLLEQAIAFFRTVFDQLRSEAALLLYFVPAENRYELIAPRQDVTPFSCEYTIEPTPDGWIRIGSLHSHGNLDESHSDVDADDERFEDGLHLTVGTIDTVPRISCDLVVGGRRFPVPLADVVDRGCAGQSVPAEWLNAVSDFNAGRRP
jgi:hypothetical protein